MVETNVAKKISKKYLIDCTVMARSKRGLPVHAFSKNQYHIFLTELLPHCFVQFQRWPVGQLTSPQSNQNQKLFRSSSQTNATPDEKGYSVALTLTFLLVTSIPNYPLLQSFLLRSTGITAHRRRCSAPGGNSSQGACDRSGSNATKSLMANLIVRSAFLPRVSGDCVARRLMVARPLSFSSAYGVCTPWYLAHWVLEAHSVFKIHPPVSSSILPWKQSTAGLSNRMELLLLSGVFEKRD